MAQLIRRPAETKLEAFLYTPDTALADRLDRLAQDIHKQGESSPKTNYLLTDGVLALALTLIGWVISLVEILVAADEEGAEQPSSSSHLAPSNTTDSTTRRQAKLLAPFESEISMASCPHLRGRLAGSDRDLRVLIDPGSEFTMIHRDAIPKSHELIKIPAFGMSGSVNSEQAIVDEGLVIDLAIQSCIVGHEYQHSSKTGADLLTETEKPEIESVSASAEELDSPRTANMQLYAYPAPGYNGDCDIILGTNVLRRINAVLDLGEEGALTFDTDLDGKLARVEAPLDWVFHDGYDPAQLDQTNASDEAEASRSDSDV